MAWHCLPFTEAAQYGVEIFYPYENELRVTTRDGQPVFEGDLGPDPQTGIMWPPFRSFGSAFYTYQLLLDLKVEAGLAVRTEPHPAPLHRSERYGADRGSGAHPQLVANDILHGVQITS